MWNKGNRSSRLRGFVLEVGIWHGGAAVPPGGWLEGEALSMCRRVLPLLLLALASPASSRAAFLEYNATWTQQLTTTTGLTAPGGESSTLPKFDPGLGTLLGVVLELTAPGTATLTCTNAVSAPRTVFASFGEGTYATIGDLVPASSAFGEAAGFGLRTPHTFTIPAHGTVTQGPVAMQIAGGFMRRFVFPEDFHKVIGPGALDVRLFTRGGQLTLGDPDVSLVRMDLSRQVNLRLTYTYAAVPEPSSMAMAATGLAGLAAAGSWRRRRRASRRARA
jgi:MYXO-CTERM domain-containing protein